MLLVPSRLHANRVRAQAMALPRTGIHTFAQLVTLLLRRAAIELPTLSAPARTMLLRTTMRRLAEAGALPNLAPVAGKAGFIADIGDLLDELAEAEATPAALAAANVGPYDAEYAAIYAAYGEALAQHNLADGPRRLALARTALRQESTVLRLELLVIDGFDQFTPTQLSLLQSLASHARQTLITLTGEPTPRPAHRRFQHTLQQVQAAFPGITVTYLDGRAASEGQNAGTLAYVERHLFNLDPPPPIGAGGALLTIAAADREREVRAALRHARTLLLGGAAPEQIALLYRDGAAYAPLLREVATEYGLPVALYEGQPLADAPPVVALRNLLALPAANYPRRALVECWRNLAAWPTPNGPADPAWTASMLDRAARAVGVSGGIERMRAALEALVAAEPPADPDEPGGPALSPAEASEVLQALDAFVIWGSPIPRARIAQHTQWLRERLFPEHGPQPFALDPVQTTILQRTLDELASADLLLGEPERDAAAFVAELEAALARVRYGAEEPRAGAIAILPVLVARGANFEHVVLLGLAEGEWPARPTEPPIYTRRERTALIAAGIPLAPRDPADERSLFYEAASRASRSLTLTRTRLDEGGNSLPASPYQRSLLELFTTQSVPARQVRAGSSPDLAEAASEQEVLIALAQSPNLQLVGRFPSLVPHITRAIAIEQAREGTTAYGRYEGLIDEETVLAALAEQLGPAHRWSITQINDYTTCPFRFAAAHLLRLVPVAEPEEGLEQVGRGRLYHAILAQAGKAWASSDLDFSASNEAPLLAALDSAAATVLEEAPTRYGFTPGPLWAWEQDHTRRRLAQAIRRALHEGGERERFRPVASEVGFGLQRGVGPLRIETSAGPALIAGRIDRIDQDEHGRLALIDYKSNSSPRRLDDTVSGRDVQLTVYTLAVEQQLAPTQSVERASFLHLGNGKRSAALTTNERVAAVTALQERLATAMVGARSGQFPVRPSAECPPSCAYQHICRLNIRKRDGF
jgi:ATP-dependent helicase/nuclease subunit B